MKSRTGNQLTSHVHPGGEKTVSTAYKEALRRLYARRWLGVKLGLENIRFLAELIGNPHHRLRFIHVAGTNGKGSTCAFLESIYRHAGYRVGLFLSPHLVSFRERIQVNRTWIPKEEVVRILEILEERLRPYADRVQPTFFEMVTAMALFYFRQQEVDVVIWETGMGGRLDATNLVDPLVSVITNVHYDHLQWLGHTLEEIAAEKAGIIKPRRPVVTGVVASSPLQVIQQTAQARQAPCFVVSPETVRETPLCRLPLQLKGPHQRHNAAIALKTVQVLQSALPVKEEAIWEGIQSAFVWGRVQILQDSKGRVIVLDGAHNPEGAQALSLTLEELFPGRRWTVIAGALIDKDWPGIWRGLEPLTQKLWLTRVQTSRSADPETLARFCRERQPDLPVQTTDHLQTALMATAEEPFRLITGSLYLVGEALQQLGLHPDEEVEERSDWVMVSTNSSPPSLQTRAFHPRS